MVTAYSVQRTHAHDGTLSTRVFVSVVCVLRVGGREANVNFESIAQISLVPLHVEFFLLSFSVPSKQEIQSQGVGCYGLFRRRHFAVV